MGTQTSKNEGYRPADVSLPTDRTDNASGPKIVLIDDDPIFIAIMKRWAVLEKVHLETYGSLDEMGFIGLFSNYDVAILDYDLGYTTGIEIARCTHSLLSDMPIIIVSYKDRSLECADAPSCVKAVLQKSKGYSHILNVASSCCKQSSLERSRKSHAK